MTVSSPAARWEYTGNGVTTEFYAGRIFAASDLVVSLITGGVETVQTLTTHYTVAIIGQVSTVTFLSPPGSGTTVVIRRVLSAVQNTSVKNQGAFLPEIHEDVFDRLTMLIQQFGDLVSRALQKPNGSTNYNAGGGRITDLANAVNPQDAITLLQAESLLAGGATTIRPGMVQQTPVPQLVNGTQNQLIMANLDTQDAILLRATGATTINGLRSPQPGESRRITLINASLTGHDITLNHESGSASSNDYKLTVLSGASLVLAPGRACTLVYVQDWNGAGVNRWVVGHPA